MWMCLHPLLGSTLENQSLFPAAAEHLLAKSPTSLGPLDQLTHGRAHISHTAQSHATTQPCPLQGLHTCQGWGVLLVVCMHRGGNAPQGNHLVLAVSPLRRCSSEVSTWEPPHCKQLPGDLVVNIPSSQWLHNSCHTNLCAQILPTFWDPSGPADHHPCTLPFSCVPSGPTWHHAWMLLVYHG